MFGSGGEVSPAPMGSGLVPRSMLEKSRYVTLQSREMGTTAEGYWQPDLMPKQCEVMNCRKKYMLVTGPVRCGKTIACAHRLLRHAWETPHARIGIFAKT